LNKVHLRNIALFLLLSIMILPGKSFAVEPLLLKQEFNGEFIGQHVLHFEDKSRKLTIEEIKSPEYTAKFAPDNQNTLNFGVSDSAHWLYFPVKNDGAKDASWFLQLEETRTNEAELYEERNGGVYRSHFGGNQLPVGMRDVKDRKIVFSLSSPPGVSGVFVRVISPGKMLTNIFMTAWGSKNYTDKNTPENLMLGLFYGSMLALLLYNFFVFLALRDMSYLWYLLYLACATMTYLGENGLGSSLFWGNSKYLGGETAIIFYHFTFLFMFLFARYFLNTPRHLPVYDVVLKWGAVLAGCFGVIAVTDVSFTFNWTYAYFASFPFPIIIYYAGIASWRKGVRQARFYVAAWSLFLLSLPFFLLKDLGVLPYSFATAYSVQIGTFLEAVIISLALADKINIMRDEKEKAEAETMIVLQKSRDELETKVTERTTELRLAKERAEGATKLKDKFVSLVSHDLRSPMATAMGLLGMVKNDTNHKMDEAKRVDMLTKAHRNLGGLVDMIDELLNLSRLQTGSMSVTKRPLMVRRIVDISFDYYVSAAEKKGVKLLNETPADMKLLADHTLIGEVLNNLVSNAIKFCKAGDGIIIGSVDSLTLTVKDTGAGIPATILPDLFKAEIKTTTVGTDGEKGTGLGLPYCKEIMKAHGGDLTVESTVGETVFFMRFLAERQVVLVADDQEVQRAIIKKHILEIRDLEIIEATNGLEALAVLKTTPVALLITDLGMPEMDGFALLKEIRGNPLLYNLPVIVNSAASGSSWIQGELIDHRKRALELGANDFIAKPVVPEDFVPRVARYLG